MQINIKNLMKNFKKFLEDREIYAKKIVDAQPWSPELAEDNYRIKDIIFSAKDGLGSIPFNQSIYYHGFVGLIKPTIFSRLALASDSRSEDSSNLEKLVKDGYALGIPFLTIKFDEDDNAKIVGHEGRARVLLIKRLNGDEPFPVHFVLSGGIRSRNISEEMITSMKEQITSEDGSYKIKNPFDKIYINGQLR